MLLRVSVFYVGFSADVVTCRAAALAELSKMRAAADEIYMAGFLQKVTTSLVTCYVQDDS